MFYPHNFGIQVDTHAIHAITYNMELSQAKFRNEELYDIFEDIYEYRDFMNLGKVSESLITIDETFPIETPYIGIILTLDIKGQEIER
jgi:hypothetical protein